VLLLAAVGVVLVGLGALILLRFPDRPGGSVRFLGMEVSSIGAGLPVLALGLLAVVLAVEQQRGDSGTPSTTNRAATAAAAASEQPGVPRCMAEFFDASPEVVVERRKYLPRRQGDDLDVLKPGEPKDTEFGLILKDRGTVVGAVKMRYDADAEEFPLDGIVDAACKPVPWTTEHDEATQNPPVAFLSDDIRFTLGKTRYNINLDQGEPVTVIGLTAG
jgi:hypothetical protein